MNTDEYLFLCCRRSLREGSAEESRIAVKTIVKSTLNKTFSKLFRVPDVPHSMSVQASLCLLRIEIVYSTENASFDEGKTNFKIKIIEAKVLRNPMKINFHSLFVAITDVLPSHFYRC